MLASGRGCAEIVIPVHLACRS